MIDRLVLSSFKCFSNQAFDFRPINIFTGYNGRGKSSVFQALLMMAQSVERHDSLQTLEVNGCFVHQDLFEDLLNRKANNKELRFVVEGHDADNKHQLEIGFRKKTSTTGKLFALSYDGVNYFEKAADLSGSDDASKKGYLFNYPSESNVLFRKYSYLSASRIGPSLYEQKTELDDINPLGSDGQYRLNLLKGNEQLKGQLNEVVSCIMDGGEISINGEDESSPVLSVGFKKIGGGDEVFKSVNCGFGYSYILSVLIQAIISDGGCLFLENPEAHLHPCAQSRLMRVICDICHRKKTQLFVETHSEHILNAVRLSVVKDETEINDQDVSIYFFDKDFTVTPLIIDSIGQIKPWPVGFFDQQEDDLSQILSLGLFHQG